MSRAKLAAGTKLQLADGSPLAYVSVAELLTLGNGGNSMKTAEVTNMDSPANGAGVIFAEFISTIADGGEVDFTYNLIADDATGQKKLRDLFDGQIHPAYIVIPVVNSSVSPIRNYRLSFDALVTLTDKIDFAIEKQMIGTGKLKVSGPVTLE